MIKYLLVFVLICLPSILNASDLNGKYMLKGYACDDPRTYFSRTIKGAEFYNDESYCTLQSKTDIRGMNAMLFDAECSSEGEEYKDRIMFMRGMEKSLYIIQDGWVGEFLLCE